MANVYFYRIFQKMVKLQDVCFMICIIHTNMQFYFVNITNLGFKEHVWTLYTGFICFRVKIKFD